VSISLPFMHVLTCSMLVMGSVTGLSAGAQEFSGDMIRSANQRTLDSSRVHVKGAMLRIETVSGGNVQYNVLLNDGDRSFVSGRAAQKWAVTSNREPGTTSVWIDERLGVVTRVQDSEQVLEFRNISEGSQPDTLFEVPSGFAKADPAALMATRNNGKAITSTSNGVVEGSGKTPETDATKIAAEAARQKADSSMAKKAKHIFHIP